MDDMFQVGNKLSRQNGVWGDMVIVKRDGNRVMICQQPSAWHFLHGTGDIQENALVQGFARWIDIADIIPDYGYLRGKPEKALRYKDRKGVIVAAEQYKGETQVVTYTHGVFSGGMCPVSWLEGVRIVRSVHRDDLFISMWLNAAKARNSGVYPESYQVVTLKVLKVDVNYGAVLRIKGTTTGKNRIDVIVLHSVPYVDAGDIIKVLGNYEGRRFVAEAVSTTRYGSGETTFHVYRKWDRLTPEQIAPYEPFSGMIKRCDGEIYIPAGME